jgi:RNA polymerase sigma factor (sigma-70 family)
VENPSRYLVGIARYKCLDALRRRGDPGVHYPTTSEGEEFAADLGEAAAENLVLCAEIRRRLAQALSKLPDNERQLLYFCFFEEVPHREAARTLGISPEAASRLKYRALDRLRFLLRSIKTGSLT